MTQDKQREPRVLKRKKLWYLAGAATVLLLLNQFGPALARYLHIKI